MYKPTEDKFGYTGTLRGTERMFVRDGEIRQMPGCNASIEAAMDLGRDVSSHVANITDLLRDSGKYAELVKYIKSLGCQADIDMLRIIGPDVADTLAYEETKRLRDRTWEKNVSEFGTDVNNWPDMERRFWEIMSRDADNYENIYC